MQQPATYYARLVRRYWAECETPQDFVALMRVRLALSKIGTLACPSPTVASAGVRSLGGKVWLRSHTTDIAVLGELLVGESYTAVTRNLDDPPRWIVDLGANVGLATRWFLARYPDAGVVAVEPEPGNVEMLRRNLRPLGDRARIVPSCIGARQRRVKLGTTAGEFAYTMSELSEGSAGEGEADVVTMDDLIDEHAITEIDLLKCDVEGAERELFEASASWIDKVRLAVIECHGAGGAQVVMRALSGSDLEVVEHEPASGLANEVVIVKQRTCGSQPVRSSW